VKRRKGRKIGKGVVLMREVADAMRAEKVLKKEGFDVHLVAPPPHLREGCDLAVEVEITEIFLIITPSQGFLQSQNFWIFG